MSQSLEILPPAPVVALPDDFSALRLGLQRQAVRGNLERVDEYVLVAREKAAENGVAAEDVRTEAIGVLAGLMGDISAMQLEVVGEVRSLSQRSRMTQRVARTVGMIAKAVKDLSPPVQQVKESRSLNVNVAATTTDGQRFSAAQSLNRYKKAPRGENGE